MIESMQKDYRKGDSFEEEEKKFKIDFFDEQNKAMVMRN